MTTSGEVAEDALYQSRKLRQKAETAAPARTARSEPPGGLMAISPVPMLTALLLGLRRHRPYLEIPLCETKAISYLGLDIF